MTTAWYTCVTCVTNKVARSNRGHYHFFSASELYVSSNISQEDREQQDWKKTHQDSGKCFKIDLKRDGGQCFERKKNCQFASTHESRSLFEV
jgi:hypothetical protein